MQNINLSLMKNWRMGESRRVQLRWEVFNVFNHPNLRILQFALRYEF